MRIQTDSTITLEARECRVLTEAAAILRHIGKVCDNVTADAISKAAATCLEAVDAFKKPTPEPPDKSKGKPTT